MSKRLLLPGFALVALTTATQAQTPVATPQTQAQTANTIDFGSIRDADATGDSESVGVIRDVLVTSEGRVGHVIIGEGGVLGFGQTLRVLPVDTLAIEQAGKVRLPGLTKERFSQLPVYGEARVRGESAAATSLPVSGANQMAPQSATTDIPVAPGAAAPPPAGTTAQSVPAKDVQAPAIPSPDTQMEAESARASKPASTAVKEDTSTGSGSTGMAPQQGTGTGATQQAPSANQGEVSNAPPPSATSPLNREYGLETKPAGQEPQQGNSSGASPKPTGAPVTGGARTGEAKPESAHTASTGTEKRWRIGKIIGGTVRGREDGIYVREIRFADGRMALVVLGQTGSTQTRELAFDALLLDGTAEEPVIAVGQGAGLR